MEIFLRIIKSALNEFKGINSSNLNVVKERERERKFEYREIKEKTIISCILEDISN